MRHGTISLRALMTGVMVTGIAGLLVASGWAIGTEHIEVLFIAMAVVGSGVFATTQRGACIGVLLLAAMNGLPVINTSSYVAGHFTVQDLAVCTLLVIAGAWILLDATPYHPSRASRIIAWVAVLLLLWCLWTVTRTVIENHVSVLQAVAFGRDFFYFALLLIVLPRVRLTNHDINVLLAILTIGVCLFAAAQIMTGLGFGGLEFLIHVDHTLRQEGLTRVYSDMTDLVVAGLAVSVAASLVARQPIMRMAAPPVALLLTISLVVQLTRARWIGFIAGFLLVSVWLMVYGDVDLSAALRKRLVVVVSVIFVAGVAAFLTVPGILSEGPFIERVLSIFSNIENGSGSVATREMVTRTMTAYLSGEWPVGLGFLSASVHYFQGLPNGSIEDPDLGILNAIMTIGVIGAALIYMPVVIILTKCLRRSPTQTQYAWLRYGGAMWIAATLISSVTLVTLFRTSGLALVAVFLTILVHPSVVEERIPIATLGDADHNPVTEQLRPTARPMPVAHPS